MKLTVELLQFADLLDELSRAVYGVASAEHETVQLLLDHVESDWQELVQLHGKLQEICQEASDG